MKNKLCNHKWKDANIILLNTKAGATVPRRVQKCKKCGVMIHLPVYTLDQLVKMEMPPNENKKWQGRLQERW